jgi:hypothetical protein
VDVEVDVLQGLEIPEILVDLTNRDEGILVRGRRTPLVDGRAVVDHVPKHDLFLGAVSTGTPMDEQIGITS